ncbi:hypothetical protein SPONN_606 [uncultured Candidatus Thioglobus sp.]|nr:hypothetical protein SPONN_606 [uncultured Candidatus Thioglobus sp.]
MQAQKQKTKNNNFFIDFFNLYDGLSQPIEIPYQQENSVAKSLYGHWSAVGDYLQFAMTEFDHEQKTHNT